jgi:tellurite resistance protein
MGAALIQTSVNLLSSAKATLFRFISQAKFFLRAFLIQTSVKLLSFAKATLFRFISQAKVLISSEKITNLDSNKVDCLDMNALNCRINLTESKAENRVPEFTPLEKKAVSLTGFTVEICGSIRAPDDGHYASIKISVMDITDGVSKAVTVHARSKQWQMQACHTSGGQDSPAFCYRADLGRLPQQTTTLLDWTTVARMNVDWLEFAYRGKRNLQFQISILSRDGGQELACANCNFVYENTAFGYIDLQENIRRAKVLAVPIAFAVSAVDQKLHNCELEVIKNWARNNLDLSETSDKAKRKLEKALNRTIAFFRDGNQIDIYEVCSELVEIAPLAERYNILELCLYVAQADGSAATEELNLLKSLAALLEVDADKFRTMMEKILPVSIHEVKDTEVLIGVTSGMSKEGSRHQLNREYAKWNARVTNCDPRVRTQADQMLKLIAEARSQYVG